MSDYNTITLEVDGDGVALVRLNRPKALNALNAELLGELAACIEALEHDAAVRCLVLTGSDRAFAAGADIKEMAAKSYADAVRRDLFAALRDDCAHPQADHRGGGGLSRWAAGASWR